MLCVVALKTCHRNNWAIAGVCRCTNHVSFSLQCFFKWWQREPFKVQRTGDCFSVCTWMLCFINAKFLVLIKTWRFMDTWAVFVLSALGNKRKKVVKVWKHESFKCFSLKIISAVFTCLDMKRDNLPELKTHTHVQKPAVWIWHRSLVWALLNSNKAPSRQVFWQL